MQLYYSLVYLLIGYLLLQKVSSEGITVCNPVYPEVYRAIWPRVVLNKHVGHFRELGT